MFTYLISTSPWLLQELLFPSRRKWTPGLSPLWEELSDQYVIRAFVHIAAYTNSLTVSQGHKWEETVSMGLLTDLVTYCVRKGQGVIQILCSPQLWSQDTVWKWEEKSRAAPRPATLWTLQAECMLKHLRWI